MRPAMRLSAASALLLTGLVGCPDYVADTMSSHVDFTTVRGEHPVPPEVLVVEVSSFAGNVEVVGTSANTVVVEAKVKLEKGRAATVTNKGDFADHVRMVQSGDRLIVADAHMEAPDSSDWHVSFIISTPASTTLAVSLGAGTVQVEGVTADLDLQSRAGEIRVIGDSIGAVKATTMAGEVRLRAGRLDGPVDASVTVGEVELEVEDVPPTKDVHLKSGTGDVVLELPAGSPGVFKAKSEVGGINLSGRKGLTVTKTELGASASGTVGQGGPTYDLSVSIGQITIR